MGDHELVLRFESQAQLEAEHAQNLSQGRAFVGGATTLPLFARCVLQLEHPLTQGLLEIPSEVVMVLPEGPMQGVALQFLNRSELALSIVASFVHTVQASPAAAPREAAADDDALVDDAFADAVADELLDETDDAAVPEDEAQRSASQERQLKLRGLSVHDRMRVAHGPSMADRVLLERIYGVLVWEPLLRNPKITVPEVARMARKGTLPRPLLELIVDNESWVRQSIVRRSLLANPRLSTDAAAKVLRTLPNRELKLVPQQTAYPATVRAAAQRLLRTS